MRISYFYIFCLFCTLMGCGGGDEISVSIDGEGLITSSPKGVLCGQGNFKCSAKFSKFPVVLTAVPPSDGSYLFSKWSEGCSGTVAVCTLNKGVDVSAIFVSSDSVSQLPSEPRVFHATPMSSTVFFIQWDSGVDTLTPKDELVYKLYASSDASNIVSEANLIKVIDGSTNSRNTYNLDVVADGLITADGIYHIAIVTVDTDGLESSASILTDLKLLDKNLEQRGGVTIHMSDAIGLSDPSIFIDESGERYEYASVASSNLPSVGDYVGQRVRVDGADYYELVKVINVADGKFTAIPAPLSDVTVESYTVSGSLKLNNDSELSEKAVESGSENSNSSPMPTEVEGDINRNKSKSGQSKNSPSLLQSTGSSKEGSTNCGGAEDITKVSLSASARGGIKRTFDYKITAFNQGHCSTPSVCDSADDFVRAKLDINARAKASMKLRGGDCYSSETIVGFQDGDLFDIKLFKGVRFRGGKFRVTSGLKFTLDAKATSDVELGTEISLNDLGFSVEIKDSNLTTNPLDPKVKVVPTVSLSGALNYTVKASPFVKMNLDLKLGGLEYEGTASAVVEGVTTVKSTSDLTAYDIYLDSYDMNLHASYVHSFTPIVLFIGLEKVKDKTVYKSDPIAIFGLPKSTGAGTAKSFQDNEMCRITYKYKDGANNPLIETPFKHYLFFDDLSEVSLGKPVSITKKDSITEYVYEYTQKNLYENYVAVAEEKKYKRIARGKSLIGETVVDNTEWKIP